MCVCVCVCVCLCVRVRACVCVGLAACSERFRSKGGIAEHSCRSDNLQTKTLNFLSLTRKRDRLTAAVYRTCVCKRYNN